MASFKLIAVGDVFVGESPCQDLLAEDLQRLFRQHDLRLCNFEAPVDTAGASPIAKAGPHMKQPRSTVDVVNRAGFNVINLANNHVYDYGQAGLRATLEAFDGRVTIGAGMDFAAAYALRTTVVNGVTVGLLGFCESEFGALTSETLTRGGYAWVNHPSVDRRVAEARKAVDVLVVQVHAGVEEVPLPLPEWRQRYREILDAGADVIVGHHPHVPQGWEMYEGKPIFYSLGNFYFDADPSPPSWNRGYAVSLRFEDGTWGDVDVIPIERTVHGVTVCGDEGYRRELAILCEMLEAPVYAAQADAQALRLWEERYRNYYVRAVTGVTTRDSWKRFLLRMVRRFGAWRRGELHSRLLLLHNLRIESHRWSAERALALIEERDGRSGPLSRGTTARTT